MSRSSQLLYFRLALALFVLATFVLTTTAAAQCTKPQFAAARLWNADQNPWAAALADPNGDGIKDSVVVNLISGDVSVFLGNGDGTFQPAVNYPTGHMPASVVVGDFNGDGIPDLAVASVYPSAVSVMLGNGDGSFQAPWPFGVGDDPTAVVAADFNLDGKMDIASANSAFNDIGIMLNTCPAH